MIPMERGRIFKILTEIFPDEGVWRDECVVPYVMKEDAGIPHDINFVCPDSTHLNGYHDIDYWLRIIDPRDDCPEYNFVLHSAISNKDTNIAIDGAGNYRIYGDEIYSVIFTTIKNNIQKFCDYAVELTELENRQAFEHVVAIINSYTNELMDTHAGEFVQRDVISRSDCTNFVLKRTPYLWNSLGVDVLRNFRKECVPSNDVWVRFYFRNYSSCTPIKIYPFRHEVKLESEHLEKLTGDIITMKECVHIAERIAKDLEYFMTTDSCNTWVKKAVGDFNTTRNLRDESDFVTDSLVEKVVVITHDWIEIMMNQGVFSSYVCDCGDNLFTLSNNRRVRILHLTYEIRVQIDGETAIKVTTRNKNWQVFLVLTIDHILKDNKPFTLHQITCLADMIREKLGIEHLYLNDTDHVLEKTSNGSYTVTDSGGKGIGEFFCGIRTPKPNAPEKVTDDINTPKEDKMLSCDEVFQVVVDWLHAISSCDRIKDVKNINHLDHTLSVINSVGCGASKQYVTEDLKVSYTPYMKTIMISLGTEHIITIDYLGLADKSTCVYILRCEHKWIDDVLNKYLVACLAEVLKDRLGMDKLRAYTTVKCTQYTELTHNGPCFFNDDGMTAYVIDPNNVISNETINKNNKPNTIIDMKEHIDDLVDKKIRKFVESGSMLYTSKDYLTDQIFSQLKNDWQKNVYISVYSSVWCTLMESRFKRTAFEFEKHFMEYVTLDNDDSFTVRFGLQRIDDNLPGIEINFYSATQEIIVRMLDHKASGSGTWSRPLIRVRPSYESIVYFDKIKNTNCTYKSFLANVVSKIVLLEGLS